MYYSATPQAVLLDERLSNSAKLLYGMIHILANAKFGCIADNNYFSKPLGVSARQVQRLLADLKECGYIEVDEIERPYKKQKGRIITVTDKALVQKDKARQEVNKAQKAYQKGTLPHDIDGSDWFDEYMAKMDR